MTRMDPLPPDHSKSGPLRAQSGLMPSTGDAVDRYREGIRTDSAAILRGGKDWHIRTDSYVLVGEGGYSFMMVRRAP